MYKYRLSTIALLLGLSLTISACGGGQEGTPADEPAEAVPSEPEVSEDAQLAMDIGPVSEPLELGDYNAEMAARGQTAFETRCVACHRLDERFLGPALSGVLDRRDPVFVINMILNPEGMLDQHPVAQEMLVEYDNIPMVSLGVEHDEARDIVEYLRQAG